MGCKVWGALECVLSNGGLGSSAKSCMHEGLIVQAVVDIGGSWGVKLAEGKTANLLASKCLRSLVGVTRMDGEE